MDIAAISSAVSAQASSQSGDAIQLAVMKKALDMETQSAMALINAIPQANGGPAHLGQTINTVA